MKIKEALKEIGVRIVSEDRWAIVNGDDLFVVYEHIPYSHKTTEIIKTSNEDAAMAALLDEGD